METWGSSLKPEECSSSKEREARSIALEKAYVHDVYQQIAHFSEPRYRAWPKVKQFILDLEPGSVMLDVGCGNGKYLSFNPSIYKIGIDRCSNLTNIAREKDHEVLVTDNLSLPFKDECFDAVLSIAVIHHFATTERRVEALRELARVLRIGGRLMVSVWAMEQRHRKFESQDVLVPWSRPLTSSSDDKTSSIELSTTTTTSDDDATHYNAYTQTSDSDSYPSLTVGRKRGRIRHRGRSIAIDPACPSSSQSSSDLSSPNESCYSFVRRALQKLAGTKRNRGGRRPWFLQGLDFQVSQEDAYGSFEDDFDPENPNNSTDHFMPIELRQLESTEFAELLQRRHEGGAQRTLFSNMLYPRRRRTLETTCGIHQTNASSIGGQPKSKSLSDLFGLIPVGLLGRGLNRKTTLFEDFKKAERERRERELLRGEPQTRAPSHLPPEDVYICHKAVQTEGPLESLRGSKEALEALNSGSMQYNIAESLTNAESFSSESGLSSINGGSERCTAKRPRPSLVKQKHSICSTTPQVVVESSIEGEEDGAEANEDLSLENKPISEADELPWSDIKNSVRELPEFKQISQEEVNTSEAGRGRGRGGSTLRPSSLGTFWKQSSLNEELIFSERLKEKEKLKQHIQKQCSLNEDLMYKERENTRWDQMKDAFFNSPNVKCLQLLKNGISNRFGGSRGSSDLAGGGGENGGEGGEFGASQSTPPPRSGHVPSGSSSSLRNGLVRMLQNWKQSEGENDYPTGGVGGSVTGVGGNRRGSKEGGGGKKGLFPPFFLRRSSAGSLNVNKDPHSSSKVLSPPPYLMRRPSENELLLQEMGANKLLPGVRHVRKLSREDGGSEEGSTSSSKDSSFQSDTSVDSEDSFASVIFIPKASLDNHGACFNSDTRANSTDSERSPKSPASCLSPPNQTPAPKSPSPLAAPTDSSTCSTLRRKSPEISPPLVKGNQTALTDLPQSQPSRASEGTKFVFDETAMSLLQTQAISEQSTDIGEVVDAKNLPSPPPLTCEKKKKVDKIVVLRKPGVVPDKSLLTRQQVRRSFPKSIAVELYNPEMDDAESSDTSSSSPNSVSSVVSVLNEEESPVQLPKDAEEPQREEEQSREIASAEDLKKFSQGLDSPSHTGPEFLETAATLLENLLSQSSPKSKRKLTMARLGSTSHWLSSLPSEPTSTGSSGGGGGSSHHPSVAKRSSSERRSGEKIYFGESKRFQPKSSVDEKWPCSIIDESPPQTAKPPAEKPLEDTGPNLSVEVSALTQSASRLLLDESGEEKDSLFGSFENLNGGGKQQPPSRNPSIDSSIRMSSTCSCSIRGGDSFDSWTSAKSSLTNSSSTQAPKISLHQLQGQCSNTSLQMPSSGKHYKNCPGSSKSSATAEEGEDSTALTYHRYYHVFREGELDKLIEKYVQNLHIISSYYDSPAQPSKVEGRPREKGFSGPRHANWCVICEKVQVWTI